MLVEPNGDLVIGGQFGSVSGVAANGVARRNGGAWSPLGFGLGNPPQALAVSPAGELLVGGDFVTADGAPAAYLTSYRSLCPATVASVGTGCAGSGGVASYAATSLPWLGTTFRGPGSGMPALAFAIAVTGLSPTSLQLGSLVQPSPQPCALRVAPELLDLTVATAGAVDTLLAIPVAPAFLGARVHQQLVALELDPSLQFVEWTSSSALVATLGDF